MYLNKQLTRWWTPSDKPNGYTVLAGSYPRVVRFYSYNNSRTAFMPFVEFTVYVIFDED